MIYNKTGKGRAWILGQTGKWPEQEATLSQDPYVGRTDPCKILGEENSSKQNPEWAGRDGGTVLLITARVVTSTGHWVDPLSWFPFARFSLPFKRASLVPFSSQSTALQRAGGCRAGRLLSDDWANSLTHNSTSLHLLTIHPVPGMAPELQVHYIICFSPQPCEGGFVLPIWQIRKGKFRSVK